MSEPQAEIGCVLGFLLLIFPGSAIIGYMIGIPVLRIIHPHFGTWYDTLSEPALSFWHAPLSISMVVGVVTMGTFMIIICLISAYLERRKRGGVKYD